MSGRYASPARRSAARRSAAQPGGTHYLLPAVAADVVRRADITAADLVFDVGAGTGALTEPLRRTGARVVAIERDPAAVRRLQRRFGAEVRIVGGDLLEVPLPGRPFRVVANSPFATTTALLRRLLSSANLSAADLVLARGVVTALAGRRPSEAALRWAVRYELTFGRRLDRSCFRPAPSVDAAVLVVRRRATDLVRGPARAAYDELVGRGHARSGIAWPDAARGMLTHRQIVRAAGDLGLDRRAPAASLTASDWGALADLSRPR